MALFSWLLTSFSLNYKSLHKGKRMQRTCIKFLREWFASTERKPLVIRGARQVGKTWVVRHFSELMGKKLIEVNLEKFPKLASVFSTNEPKVIIEKLGTALNTTIIPSECILFIDEIQEKPEIFAKLRWFAEDMPELPVIAAGSLLEFVLGKHNMSMPVGRIGYLYLEPLSFEEFLAAHKNDLLIKYLKEYSWKEAIPDVIHERLMTLFKEYLIVGGMPAVVSSWITNRSFPDVAKNHHDILKTYRDDFSKYSRRILPERLEEIVTAVPQSLGRKFVV